MLLRFFSGSFTIFKRSSEDLSGVLEFRVHCGGGELPGFLPAHPSPIGCVDRPSKLEKQSPTPGLPSHKALCHGDSLLRPPAHTPAAHGALA